MDFVLSSVMDLLLNCLFMNTTTFSQDCLLPEQLVIGQAIPQDFLKILLDKLSGDNKTFLVNQEDIEGRQQGPETKLNDEPSGDMDGKEDLLSLYSMVLSGSDEHGHLPCKRLREGEGPAQSATADPRDQKDDSSRTQSPGSFFPGR